MDRRAGPTLGPADEAGPNRRDLAGLAAGGLAAAGLAASGRAAAGREGSRPPPLRVAMLLFPGMTALDVVGPQNLLSGLAGPRIHLVAEHRGPVTSDTGLAIVATADFTSCPRDLHVLFVPGGDGTPGQMRNETLLAFLRDRAERAAWVTSVCTGSLILGAAGLLTGYRATSHWCVRDSVLPLFGAIPVEARVVFDRNRCTAAGVSAGLDFALALAARLRDPDHARTSQLVAEYAPSPPFDAGTPHAAGPAITRAANAILEDLARGSLAAARARRD
ncbi:DJ-1/PfpI family protein [Methylobacterium sp. J-090]|uniref:DJ-1/PfpI family protein n=1 Tax=Methylobacterium sp. J-090 TaxID=2836666 RepID=UPI001FB9E61A|nr:DJ-1/PfpI family protein [Methylobacterium sp. J-090]MCJ2082744.1 DJ-1/PfpI family protein [Methylobacterium sp. J-090]